MTKEQLEEVKRIDRDIDIMERLLLDYDKMNNECSPLLIVDYELNYRCDFVYEFSKKFMSEFKDWVKQKQKEYIQNIEEM